MDSKHSKNNRSSGAKAPKINLPGGNDRSNDSVPDRRRRVYPVGSKDSLRNYVSYGSANVATGSIYEAPSPNVSSAEKDWSAYQPMCEDVTDEDLPKPKVTFREPEAGKQRRQSTREQGTPSSKASTPVDSRRSSTATSPVASRKPSPAIDPFPRSVSWDADIRPDRVRDNAYNILPPCRHWAGMSNLQGLHSAPVLSWDRGYFQHESSALDLSMCAEKLPSGKYILPQEAHYNSNDGSELTSGWWKVGLSNAREKLLACTSCMSGLMSILPEQLFQFAPMEAYEARNHKCHFSSLLVRFGWFLMLHKVRRWDTSKSRVQDDRWYMFVHTLTLLGRAVYQEPRACSNDNLRVGTWYSFPVDYSKTDNRAKFRLDCLICPQDYALITSLFPWTVRFLDRVPKDEVLMQPHLCSMRMDTVRWNELVSTMYMGCAGYKGMLYDGTTPIVSRKRPGELDFYPGGKVEPWVLRNETRLPALLTKEVPFDRCPRDNNMVGFTWFVIPELPEFTVCHHCYATEVLPLRRAGSTIAQAFLPRPEYPRQASLRTPRLAPPSGSSSPRHSRSSSSQSGISTTDLGSFCQLYSTRMRDIFKFAAATDPIPVSGGKARFLGEQWQIEQREWRKAVNSPVLSRAQPMGGSTGGSSGSRTPNDDDKPAVAFPLVNFPSYEDAFEYLKDRVTYRYKILIDRMRAEKHLDVVEKDRSYSERELRDARRNFNHLDAEWEDVE